MGASTLAALPRMIFDRKMLWAWDLDGEAAATEFKASCVSTYRVLGARNLPTHVVHFGEFQIASFSPNP